MKRSEINAIIEEARAFFESMQFALPPWAFWKPGDWRGRRETCREIVGNQLGWDVTDFGSNAYAERGLVVFAIRNGNPKRDRKVYAEKIMIMEEVQQVPLHFHWSKMEDIINRGGGNLAIDLWGSTPDEDLSGEPLTARVDGIARTFEPGETLLLTPGQSICLEPGMYHRFYGQPGKGRVLVGEVSSVNDDTADNRWYDAPGRFPEIEEDAEPVHLLLSDYERWL